MSQPNFIFRVSASSAPSVGFSRTQASQQKPIKIPLMLQVNEEVCPCCGSSMFVREGVQSETGDVESSCLDCLSTWNDEV